MSASIASSPHAPRGTYQHLYGFLGSNSHPYHNSDGVRSMSFTPPRNSQGSSLLPPMIHGNLPKRSKGFQSNGRGGDARRQSTRPRSHTTGVPPSRRGDYALRYPKRSSSSISTSTTQRPGRLGTRANVMYTGITNRLDGDTFVADVNPTFCVDGCMRYIEPIGERVAWTAEYDGSIRIRALPQGSEIQSLEGRENTFCTCLLHLPEYKCVWAAFNDGFMRVYDEATAAMQKEFVQHADGVNCMIELEGSVYTGGVDWKICLWNPETITYERLFFGHAGGVRCLCTFSGASGSILFSGSDDGTIKAWDPYAPLQTEEDRACLHTFKGHDRGVLCLETISPLSQLWSGGEDGTVRVWDLKTLECMNVLEAHTSPVSSLLLVESRMWSGDKHGYIILWDVLVQAPLQEITSRLHDAKLGMVLTMKKIQPCTSWKVWTAGSTGYVQSWNAETVPIVFDRKYAYQYGQRGLHDMVMEMESFIQLLEDELATCKEEAARQYERGRIEVQHVLEAEQVIQQENENLRRRLREKGVELEGEGGRDENLREKEEDGFRYANDRYNELKKREEKDEKQRRRERELQEKIKGLEDEVDRLKRQLALASSAPPLALSAPSSVSPFFPSMSSSFHNGATSPTSGTSTTTTAPTSSPLHFTPAAALFPPGEEYKGSVSCTSHHVLVPGQYWENILHSRPHQVQEWAKEDICMAIGIPSSQLYDLTCGVVDVVEAEIEEEDRYKRIGKGEIPFRLRYKPFRLSSPHRDGTTGIHTVRHGRLSFLDVGNSYGVGTATPSYGSSSSSNSDSTSGTFHFREENHSTSASADTPPTLIPFGTHCRAQEEGVIKSGSGLCLRLDVVHSTQFSETEVQRRLDSFAFPRLVRLHERVQQFMQAPEGGDEKRKVSKLVKKVGLDAAEDYINELENRLAALESLSIHSSFKKTYSKEEEKKDVEEVEEEEMGEKYEQLQKKGVIKMEGREENRGQEAKVRKVRWSEQQEGGDKEDEEEEDEEEDEEEESEDKENTEKEEIIRDLRQELENAKDNVEYYKDVITEKEKQRVALSEEVQRLRALVIMLEKESYPFLQGPSTALGFGGNKGKGEESTSPSAEPGTECAGINGGETKEKVRNKLDMVEAMRVIAHLQALLAASKKKAQLVQEEFAHFFRQLSASPIGTPTLTTTTSSMRQHTGFGGNKSSSAAGLSSSSPLNPSSLEEEEEERKRVEREGVRKGRRGNGNGAHPISSFIYAFPGVFPSNPSFSQKDPPDPSLDPSAQVKCALAGQQEEKVRRAVPQGNTPSTTSFPPHSELARHPSHYSNSSSFQRIQNQLPPADYPSSSSSSSSPTSSSSSSSSWISESSAKNAAHPATRPYNAQHLPPPLQEYGSRSRDKLNEPWMSGVSSSVKKKGGAVAVDYLYENKKGSTEAAKGYSPKPLSAEKIQRDSLLRPPYPAWVHTVLQSSSSAREGKGTHKKVVSSAPPLYEEDEDNDDEKEDDVRALYIKQFHKADVLPPPQTTVGTPTPWAPLQPGGNRGEEKVSHQGTGTKPENKGRPPLSLSSSISHLRGWNQGRESQGTTTEKEDQGYATKGTTTGGRSCSSSVPISPPPRATHERPRGPNPYIGLSAEQILALPLPSEMLLSEREGGGGGRCSSKHSTEELSAMNAALLTRVADVEAVMSILSKQHEQSMPRPRSVGQRK